MNKYLPPTETHLNQIVNRSFQQHGFSCKIPDSGNKHLSKRPFDGFSVMHNKFCVWESKMITKGDSFYFSDIRPHQYENLDFISTLMSWDTAFYILGIWDIDHFEILITSHKYIKDLKKEGHKSLTPNDLTALASAYSLTVEGKVTKNYSNLVIKHIDQAVII